MGKTRNDEEYEKGVRDGQKGGFFDDAVHGVTQEGSPYDKGYKYGAEHRYGSEGRHHSWDSRGTDDSKEKRQETSSSFGGGGGGGGGGGLGGLGAGIFGFLFVLFSIFAIFSSIDTEIKQNKIKKQIIKENSLVRIDIAKDAMVPTWMNDYSLSPDKSQIVFSQRVMTDIHYSAWSSSNAERSRIFLKDLANGGQWFIGFNRGDRETYQDISSNDFVAPLFSPNGNRIAFATTRGDQPSAAYVINKDGSRLKRISDWHDTVVFGWISNDVLFIWGSHYCSANIFDPFIYESGKSYMADVNNYVAPEPGISFEPQKKFKHVPDNYIKIKYVSAGSVRDYVIKEKAEIKSEENSPETEIATADTESETSVIEEEDDEEGD